MSFANPGKRGLLTVIALMLIVGVPGVIAYADGSDDVYYSLIDDSAVPDHVSLYDSVVGSSATHSLTAVENGDGYDVVIDDISDLTSITRFSVYDSGAELTSIPSKLVVSTDLHATSVSVTFTGNGFSSFTCEYDEESDSWVYEFSSVELASLSDYTSFVVVILLDSEAGSDVSEFYLSVQTYSSETIFTDDVVELIVMVGGILLLICGTFALSFIDVDTPGKAVSYAKRGIRSAGNKMRRGKK